MQAVLVPTQTVPSTPVIRGVDFDHGTDLDAVMGAMLTTGFQATALGQAVNEVNRMVSKRGAYR
jgi:deoxyhypusine synthase